MKNKIFLAFCSVLAYGTLGFGAPVILNEYNAVSGSNYLNGGTATGDIDGGYAQDSYFGRVLGNGGDWFELVVIQDHLDMRRWKLDISYFDGTTRQTEVLDLTNHSIWSDLRSGTIITISEDVPDDVSYDPLHGDWWINVRASASGSGLYIEKQNFPVNNDDWQLKIMTADNIVKFGSAGEGVVPGGPGVSSTEIFRLDANPSSSITPLSNYNDGITLSTFGKENRWPGGNKQDFTALRAAVAGPEPGLFLLALNGGEVLTVGEMYPITWLSTGSISNVLIEYSTDNGSSWTSIATVPNTGSYDWLVPAVDSNQCLVRISDASNSAIADTSDDEFTILVCQSSFDGDLNGDCYVNLLDFSIFAKDWLQCGNPLDPNCIP